MDGRDDVNGRCDGRTKTDGAAAPTTRTRTAGAPRGSRQAAVALGGICLALVAGTPVAQTDTCSDTSSDAAVDESTPALTPGSESAPAGESRGGMIPRDALVDMSRAQSRLVCASEIFLGCMGFDGSMCLSLSESAIERCLMPLPAEIDPTTLDNDTLEACPKAVYAKAGYDESKAATCLEKALEES